MSYSGAPRSVRASHFHQCVYDSPAKASWQLDTASTDFILDVIDEVSPRKQEGIQERHVTSCEFPHTDNHTSDRCGLHDISRC